MMLRIEMGRHFIYKQIASLERLLEHSSDVSNTAVCLMQPGYIREQKNGIPARRISADVDGFVYYDTTYHYIEINYGVT